MPLWQTLVPVLWQACAASAQSSDGSWLVTAATLGFDRSSPIGNPASRGAEFHDKEAGLGRTPPTFQGSAGAGIDLSSNVLFRACANDPIATEPLPDIDALSLGEDLVNVDATGGIGSASPITNT